MFDDRDYGHFLLDTIDLDAQLLAIRAMLARNRQADDQLSEDIKTLDAQARSARGDLAHHLVDLTIDEMHGSVYQSAATSAAAVGALAPLLESFFSEIFASLRKHYAAELTEGLSAIRPEKPDFDPWNPYHYLGSRGPRTEIALGILQLAKATGLSQRLPEDHAALIEALFAYRNKMLHRGFEWPLRERHAFFKVAAEKRWPENWFDCSQQGDDPWVIYITDVFINRCLKFIDELLEAAGAYNKALRAQRPVMSAEEYREILANLPEGLKSPPAEAVLIKPPKP
jgi:hypothetical protein